MSQNWGPLPPRGDHWASSSAPMSPGPPDMMQQTVLGPPPTGPYGAPPPWSTASVPPLWPTVLITALFGLFGLIPASAAANRANQQALPSGRYWQAFGITFGVALLVQAVLLVVLVAPALRAGVPGVGTRPTLSAGDDTYAPTPSRTQPTRAPVTQPTRPTPTATRTPSTSTTPPRSTQPTQVQNQTVTSLPSGSWITVLDSLPKADRTEQDAWAMATGLSGAASVVVVDSDRISGLNNGYWAVSVIGSSSRTEANGWCSALNRPVGGTCYPRQVS